MRRFRRWLFPASAPGCAMTDLRVVVFAPAQSCYRHEWLADWEVWVRTKA